MRSGVAYSLLFESWEAAVAAGLDLERWDTGGYKTSFQARVIAWYRGRVAIGVHSSDAQNTDALKRQKKNKRH